MTKPINKAEEYANSKVPNPDRNDAPYFTSQDRWQDVYEAYEAGEKDTERLKKENERMRTAIKRALELKSLWLYSGDVKAEHLHEAFALQRMEFSLEQSLK